MEFGSDLILNTFGEREIRRIEKFSKVTELRNGGTRIKEISKLTSIPETTVISWVYGTAKPVALRSIEACKIRRLVPIRTDSKRFVTLLEVFAWIFGDGNMNVKFGIVNLFGRKLDLEKIAVRITNEFGFTCKIRECTGTSDDPDNCTLSIQGKGIRAFARMLKAMGAPDGNKVEQEFLIPKWLFLLKPRLKNIFLEVFLSNEMCVRNIMRENTFPEIGIKMRKLGNMKQNLIDFLDQIGDLLNGFGIDTKRSKIVYEKIYKDGIKSDAFISIGSSITNIIRFTKIFRLIFAEEKQQVLYRFNKLAFDKALNRLKFIRAFEVAIKLREDGLTIAEISRELNLSTCTVNFWVNGKAKPRLLDNKMDLLKAISFDAKYSNDLIKEIPNAIKTTG